MQHVGLASPRCGRAAPRPRSRRTPPSGPRRSWRRRAWRSAARGHAAHVDRHPVALLDAHALEDVGELAHLAVERVVGEGAHVAVLALPDQRQLVAPPGGEVAVEAVVDDVGLGADEPLVERLVRVVQHLRPLLEPLQLLGALLPEGDQVRRGLGAQGVVVLDMGAPYRLLLRTPEIARFGFLCHGLPPNLFPLTSVT